MSLFSKSALVICTLLSAASVKAQDDSCLRRTVLVSVLSADKAEAVAGLTLQNFHGKTRGKPVRIISAERASEPRRVIVLLDTSGSMVNKLPAARNLVLALVFNAPAQSTVAFMAFADKVEQVVGFDQSRDEIALAVGALGDGKHPAGKGKTALYDAILEALRLLRSPNSQDVIYVVSDGGDNAGRADKIQTRAALLRSGVRLFAIALLDLNPPTLEEVFLSDEFAKLPEDTGGSPLISYEFPRDSASGSGYIMDLARSALARATQSYRLELELPEAPAKKQGWKLEVVDAPKPYDRVKLFYPHDLLPCSEVAPQK